jgi:hypothetical protein
MRKMGAQGVDRKVTHVSRFQTGRYVRVFAYFWLLVHVSV